VRVDYTSKQTDFMLLFCFLSDFVYINQPIYSFDGGGKEAKKEHE
jgi:hypothetical protein